MTTSGSLAVFDQGLLPRLFPVPPPLHLLDGVEQAEIRVHRLEVTRICLSKVTIEAAQHGGDRRYCGWETAQAPREIDPGEKTGTQ